MENTTILGIDISKNTLDASVYCFGQPVSAYPHRQFPNDGKGFARLLKWLRKCGHTVRQTVACMEHTGHYGTALCLYLENRACATASSIPWR